MLPPHKFRMFKLVKKKIDSLNYNTSILDVGCGSGWFLKKFKNFKIRTGVDIKTRKNDELNLIEADYLKVNLDMKFEIIMNLLTLEHIKDDEAVIKKTYNDLKEDGHFFLLVPSKNNFHRINKYAKHYRTYGKENLLDLLEKSNFKILSIEHLGFPIYNFILFFYENYLRFSGIPKKEPNYVKKGVVTNPLLRLLFPLFYPLMYLDYFFKNTRYGTHYLIETIKFNQKN